MKKTSSLTTLRTCLRRFTWYAVSAATVLGCAMARTASAAAGRDNRAPGVPAILSAGDTNKVSFHGYAVGVQIYAATPSATSPTGFAWTFKAPEAFLFDDHSNVVSIHYAGPTWESNSGSKVVGARVAGVTVDTNAIPWLLLRAVSSEGPGIFERTTFVQRVNTTGGLAPAMAPTQAGQEARVPYAADYYFFRSTRQ